MANNAAQSRKLDIFIPIKKIDEEQRLVYGQVAAEVEDNSGEIFDYEGSKPYFEEWSDNAYNTSGGKSYGNVRVMHTSKVAGLIASPLSFNDEEKTIEAVAKVVDDDEWKMVLAGGYTGFSMGGRYVERINKGSEKRYVAAPVEVSLVDKPCIPTAVFFDVIKADGLVERREFIHKADDDTSAGGGGRATGDAQSRSEPDLPERRLDAPSPSRRGDKGKFRGKTETESHGGSDPTGHGSPEAKATTKSDSGETQMRIPTNDEVLPHAKALAKAAGRDSAWVDFMEEARDRMVKGEYGDAWAQPGSVEHVVVDGKAKTKGVEGHDDHDNPNNTRGTGAGGAPTVEEGVHDATGKNKDDLSGKPGARKGDMPDDANKADDHEDDCKCDKCMEKADRPEIDPKDDDSDPNAARKTDEDRSEGEAVAAPSAEKAAGLKQVWQTSDGRSFSKKADAAEHEDKLAKKAAGDNSLTSLLGKAVAMVSDLAKADDGGDTDYADPKNEKYPIDTEAHIRAAWSYINMPKNQKDYSSAEVSAIKNRIVAAWKDKIDDKGPPSKAEKSDVVEFGGAVSANIDRLRKFADDNLVKGMYTISRLAGLIESLECLHASVCCEEEYEGDGSPLPAAMFASLKSLGENLVTMAEEEVKEMLTARGGTAGIEVLELAATTLGLQKGDLETDLQKRMGSVAPVGDVVTKADFDAVVEKSAKLEEEMSKAVPLIKSLMDEVDRIKNMPMPMRRPQAVVVEKSADVSDAPAPDTTEDLLAKYTPSQLVDASIRLAQQHGRPFVMPAGGIR